MPRIPWSFTYTHVRVVSVCWLAHIDQCVPVPKFWSPPSVYLIGSAIITQTTLPHGVGGPHDLSSLFEWWWNAKLSLFVQKTRMSFHEVFWGWRWSSLTCETLKASVEAWDAQLKMGQCYDKFSSQWQANFSRRVSHWNRVYNMESADSRCAWHFKYQLLGGVHNPEVCFCFHFLGISIFVVNCLTSLKAVLFLTSFQTCRRHPMPPSTNLCPLTPTGHTQIHEAKSLPPD